MQEVCQVDLIPQSSAVFVALFEEPYAHGIRSESLCIQYHPKLVSVKAMEYMLLIY